MFHFDSGGRKKKVDEFQTAGDVSGLAAKSVGHLHSLTHLPADPSCPVCVQAKITKAPATREQEDSKDVATSFGDRIHCDLVGPTRASINDEVYAMVTRDEATNYPSVRALRNKSSEETAAAWKIKCIRAICDTHLGQPQPRLVLRES